LASLKSETIAFHKRHDIPILPLATEEVFGRTYDVGAKIVAADAPRSGTYGIFMDTDTMLVSNTSFHPLARWGAISAFPTLTKSLNFTREDWARLYKKFGFQVPRMRFRFDYSGQAVLDFPYFNAGLIIFPEGSLGSTWLEVTKSIQDDIQDPSQRLWLDQISLPIAIKKAGLATHPLERKFNFPVEEEFKEIRADIHIIHYHFGINLHRCSRADIVNLIVKDSTQFASLEEMISAYGFSGYTRRS
jgi:hypothetical protein